MLISQNLKKNSLIFFVVAIAVVVWILESKSDDKSTKDENALFDVEKLEQSTNRPMTIRWHNGKVFTPDFVIWDRKFDNIVFRQGPQFWPTEGIEIALRKKPQSGTVISLDNVSVHIQEKLLDTETRYPDSHYTRGTVGGHIEFGEITEIGAPIEVHLNIKDIVNNIHHEYHILGSAFAATGEYRIINKQVDRLHDSGDTLKYVAKKYLRSKHGSEITILDQYHISYLSPDDKPFPKEGQFAFRYEAAGKMHTIKIQLYKDEHGWHVYRELTRSQLYAAHRILPIKDEDTTGKLVHGVIAVKLQQDLIEENIVESVRYVDLNVFDCKYTLKKGVGLCNATIHIEKDGKEYCQLRNYFVTNEGGDWAIEKQVDSNLEFDYKSGSLIVMDKKKNEKSHIAVKLFKQLFEECREH